MIQISFAKYNKIFREFAKIKSLIPYNTLTNSMYILLAKI